MLDINFIRQNKDIVKEGITNKGFDASVVDKVLGLDEKRRKLLLEIEQLRAKRNKIADAKKFSEEGKIIKEQLKDKEPELENAGKEYLETLQKIPNLPSDKAPVGKNEKDNI